MLISKKLCETIKNLRLKQDMSVKEFAESIGVTMDALYKIEAQKRNPSVDLLLKIKKIYDVRLVIE